MPKDPGYGSLHDMQDQVDMSPTINIEVICMLWFPSLQERVIINTVHYALKRSTTDHLASISKIRLRKPNCFAKVSPYLQAHDFLIMAVVMQMFMNKSIAHYPSNESSMQV